MTAPPAEPASASVGIIQGPCQPGAWKLTMRRGAAQSERRISVCILVRESGCNFLLHVSDLARVECWVLAVGSHGRRARVLG